MYTTFIENSCLTLFSVLQLRRGGAVLLPELVRDGQVGPALGPLRDHDDRRTLLHLLHLRPARYGQTIEEGRAASKSPH
jgi:hypothetical protein